MAKDTKIQWCDHTFNPWRGCTKVAPGCANCYAEAQSRRNPSVLGIWGEDGSRVVASADMWKQPVKWGRDAARNGKPLRVFCGSLMDWAEDWDGECHDSSGRAHYTSDADYSRMVQNSAMFGCDTDGFHYTTLRDCRGRLFRLIDDTPELDWLLLTKRPENILKHWQSTGTTCDQVSRRHNVWLGTSVACQADADRVAPLLLRCGDLVPVLFLSVEPLIGPVDLSPWLFSSDGFVSTARGPWHRDDGGHAIDWVIVGGESGPNARPCRVEWVRSIVRQCRKAGVPCFVKQLGVNVVTRNDMVDDQFNSRDTGWPDPEVEYHIHGFRENFQGADCRIRLRDPKGGDPLEWPEDLRVRQVPQNKMAIQDARS